MNQGSRNPRRIRVLESMDSMDPCVGSMPDSGDLSLWQSGAAMLAAYWICLASGVLPPCYILLLATPMEFQKSVYLSIYELPSHVYPPLSDNSDFYTCYYDNSEGYTRLAIWQQVFFFFSQKLIISVIFLNLPTTHPSRCMQIWGGGLWRLEDEPRKEGG